MGPPGQRPPAVLQHYCGPQQALEVFGATMNDGSIDCQMQGSARRMESGETHFSELNMCPQLTDDEDGPHPFAVTITNF